MNADDLLKEFSDAGIQLWREGENLRFRAPGASWTTDVWRSCAATRRNC